MSDDIHRDDDSPEIPQARSGRHAIEEIERMRELPNQFSCLGMGCGGTIVAAALLWFLWKHL